MGTDAPRGDASAATVIDGSGKYVTPGLIDGHVHLAQVPGMLLQHESAMPAVVEAYYRQLPRSYLYFGFTTVIDLNVVDRERVETIRAAEIGPAVFDCGNALALANGYPMAYGPPATRFKSYPNFLYDPRQAASIPSEYPSNEHTPEAAVERVVAGGGICVKAHYETGFDRRIGSLPVPTANLMRQARDAGHRHRLPLLLHANSLEAHRFAVEVGADAVVHGLWNFGGGLPGGRNLPEEVREVLDAEVRNGIAYMPTSRVLSGLGDLFDSAFLNDPHLARVLPSELLAWYGTEEGGWFKSEMKRDFGGLSDERILERWGTVSERHRATSYVAAQGARIIFGSDTPSAPTYANPPGYNGYLELREMEALGMTPRQVLVSATLENARLFGLANDYGTIAPGKVASLLLLRENPLTSTVAFDTIETIIVKGRSHSRKSLAAN
ncbi:MAG: amidohydrolase family protein [Acidobacteria bacterium]|nr:amidohydrolase family protein [Acidobacteriota bacterium]